jgi:acyl-coenzyme A synthetase/AMP-(fatty) acid ligase
MSRVLAKRSPITGALIAAEVVLEDESAAASDGTAGECTRDILRHCRDSLPMHKVPATIRVVTALGVGAAGKLDRR